MVEEFEKQVVETQTGGETPVTQNKVPQNIKPVETTPVQPLPEPVPNPVSPIQQKQVSVESVTNKQPDGVNETFAKELYDYTNKYNLMTSGKEINYDKFVGKYLSSPQALESYYETILPRSKVLPFTIPFKDKNDFINKAFTPVQEAKQQDVSSFIRSPFQSDTEGYNENITKGIQEDISGNAVSIANKQENISDNITEAATIKIDDVKKKYGLMQEGKKAVVEGMVGTAEEMIPKEKSIFEKMEESKPDDNRYAEYLKQKEEDITLQNWNPEGYGRLPKADLPVFSMTNLKNAPEEVEKYNFDVALATKYNENDLKSFGNNPFYALDKSTAIEQGKPVFAWDKDITNSSTNTEYWEKVGENFEYIPLLSVDAYGRRDESLKKLPASMQMPFDHLWKYESTINPQSTKVWGEIVDIEKTKKLKGGKYPEETFKPVSKLKEIAIDYFNFDSKESQGKQLIDIAKKKNVIADQKYVLDIENAFELQRRSVIGEYRKGIVTKDQAEKALSGLEKTYNKIYDINPEIKGIRDKMRSDYNKAVAEQKQADITEKRRRIEYPILAELWYGSGARGGWEGAKEVMRDFAGLVDFVTQTNSTFTSDIRKTFGEAVTPSSLQGDIFEDGKFHPSRLLDRSANVVSQMGGLIIGSKGFGTFGKMAKNLTGVAKLESYLPQYLSSFNMMYDDNHDYAKSELTKQGISGDAAEIIADDYAIRVTNAVSLVEGMFDIPFTKGLSKIKDDFSALIKAADSGFMATTKAIGSGMKNFTTEGLKEGSEEFAQELLTKAENARFNVNSGISSLDENLDKKEILELLTVTGASVLAMGAGTGRLIDTPLTKKVAIWNAVQDPANFSKQLDTWVEKGRITKEQATVMKQGVDEVKSVITGLPSGKELTDKQKIDLGLLIYEKKKLDEEVKSGYVDELFRQQKMTEIEGKKKKLDGEILKVYNQNNDRNAVLEERDRILKEKREAEIYAEKELIKRVQGNVEGLEAEEKLAEDLITAQRTREQEPAKKKARGGQAAKVAPEQRFDIKDGHHRFIAYSETGVTEVPVINKETGEQITIPIEQLEPTQDLTEKDREVIDGLKESITKGETIEPIEVEPSKIKQDAEAIRSTQERLTEAGQITEVGQDNGGKNIQQQTQAGTETGERKAQVLKKPTKDEASRSHILNPKVNPRTADRAVTDLTTTTVGGKKIKATPSQVKVMAKEAGLEALGAKTPTQLYRQAKAQGIPMQEFLDAVDVGMGRTKGKKEFGEERKPIEKEAVSVKSSEKEKIEPVKEEDIKKNAYIVDLKNKNKSIEDKSKKVEAENKSEAGRIREQVKAETKEEVKQGLETIAEALESPDVTSSADVMVGDKKIGQWLTEQVATGKMTREEMKRINDIHVKNRDRYGSAQKAKKEIEENERQMSRIEKILKGIEELDYVGTKTTNMGIFTIPINMPIAVAKGMAKVILKGMDMYNNAIAGRDAIKYMKDSKWYNNLSSKEKNAVNKFLKGMDTFEAATLIIEDAATSKGVSGEKMVKEVEKGIKSREKEVAKEKDIRDKVKVEEKKRGEVREKKTATKEFQRGATEGYNFGEASGTIAGEIAGMKKGLKQGLKEGKVNQKNIAKKVKEYLRKSKFKTQVSVKSVKDLLSAAAKVTTEAELDTFLREYNKVMHQEVIFNRANILRKKIKTSVKSRLKSNKISAEHAEKIMSLMSIDPESIYDAGGIQLLDEYAKMSYDIMNDISSMSFKQGTIDLKNTGIKITNEQISDFVKNANEKYEEYLFDRLKAKNTDLIQAMQTVGLLGSKYTYNELTSLMDKLNVGDSKVADKINEETSLNRLNAMKEQVSSDITRLRSEIDNNSFSGLDEKRRSVINNISKLNVASMTAEQLIRANYVINNIIANKSVVGAGPIEAVAIAHEASKKMMDLFERYNVKGLREFNDYIAANNFMSIPAVRNAISKNRKMAAELGDILEQAQLSSGYSSVISDQNKAWSEPLKRLKKKYGKAIVQNPANRIRQGMYATIIQWQGSTPEDMQDWFDDNKRLIEEDIEKKKKAIDKDINLEADIEEKIYNEVFKNAETMEQAHKNMSKYAGDKAVVNLAQQAYNKNIDSFKFSTEVYGNKEADLWNNYTHRRWKERGESVRRFTEFEAIAENKSMNFNPFSKNVNKSMSSASKNRSTIRPSETRVLNLDFYNTQDKGIHDSYYQAKTLGTRYAIKEIFSNSDIAKLLGDKNHNTLSERTLQAINYQMGSSAQQLNVSKGISKMLSFWLRHKTAQALAGPSALLKQSVPGLVGAFVLNRYGYKALPYMFTKVDPNMFKHSNLQGRANALYESNIEGMQSIGEPVLKRGFGKVINNIDELHRKTIEGENIVGKVVGLKPLQTADFYTAKGAWMTYYEQRWKQLNPGKDFSWKEQEVNPDKTASVYADQMIETTMNVNDPSNAGSFFQNSTALMRVFRSIFSPFASFAINQDYRLLDDARKMMSMNPSQAWDGARDIISVAAEQMAFAYVKQALAVGMAYTIASAISLTGGDSDDEFEKALTKYKLTFGENAKYGFNTAVLNTSIDMIPTLATIPVIGGLAESGAKEWLNEVAKESSWFRSMFGDGADKLFPTKGYNMFGADENFDVDTRLAITLDAFGMLGESVHDFIKTVKKLDVGIFGYKDKKGKTIELNDAQKTMLWSSIGMEMLGYGTGFTFNEWKQISNSLLYDIQNQMKPSKRKGGRGSMYKGTYSGSGYGKSGY